MPLNYIIADIRPRDGELTELHQNILGRRCRIVELEPGKRCLLYCDVRDDPGHPHRISTSVVTRSEAQDNGDRVEIQTMNTTYVLCVAESLSEGGSAACQ